MFVFGEVFRIMGSIKLGRFMPVGRREAVF